MPEISAGLRVATQSLISQSTSVPILANAPEFVVYLHDRRCTIQTIGSQRAKRTAEDQTHVRNTRTPLPSLRGRRWDVFAHGREDDFALTLALAQGSTAAILSRSCSPPQNMLLLEYPPSNVERGQADPSSTVA
ncbi:hypothetical protein DPSP01_006097 [Paraphaeosphaeria sporulosa]